jgi:hypothetical protein
MLADQFQNFKECNFNLAIASEREISMTKYLLTLRQHKVICDALLNYTDFREFTRKVAGNSLCCGEAEAVYAIYSDVFNDDKKSFHQFIKSHTRTRYTLSVTAEAENFRAYYDEGAYDLAFEQASNFLNSAGREAIIEENLFRAELVFQPLSYNFSQDEVLKKAA